MPPSSWPSRTPKHFCQLPWNKRVARVFCTVFFCREDPERPEEFLDADCTREFCGACTTRSSGTTKALHMRVGCEPEMLWLKPGDGEKPYYETTKPYAYHIDQFEQLEEVWLKLYEYGTAMGLDMIQADHEDAPGMIEMNFQYDDALRTSDRLTSYRQLCAQVARECGLIAVFMSKPYMSLSGNGCHHNLSLWRGGEDAVQSIGRQGQPAMDDVFAYRSGGTNEIENPNHAWMPSELGRHALGGMLAHLNALVAIGSSTVNSYRRLNDTGLWAPIGAGWGLQNRSCAVRVSSPDRLEFRCVDSMVNPYLMQAALLKAIDDGIRNRIDPGRARRPEFRRSVERGRGDRTYSHHPARRARRAGGRRRDQVRPPRRPVPGLRVVQERRMEQVHLASLRLGCEHVFGLLALSGVQEKRGWHSSLRPHR